MTDPSAPGAIRVLVDATSARTGGGLSYLEQQLAALLRESRRPARSAPGNALECTLLTAPWNHDRLAALGLPSIRVPLRGTAHRLVWEQTLLLVRSRSYDLLYQPGNIGPLVWSPVPTVVTVQNANYFGSARRAEYNRSPARRLRITLCHRSLRRASAVVVISHALHADMVATVGLTLDERFVVVPSGPSDLSGVAPVPVPALHDVHDFVLVLANDAPHKRIGDAILAWSRARTTRPATGALVLAGSVGDRSAEVVRGLPDDQRSCVFELGPVYERGQVRWLLERAATMVSASELEAYPLTPEEAISVGVRPVLTDIAAHREVAAGVEGGPRSPRAPGDPHGAAEFAPVGDIGAIADAIVRAVGHGRSMSGSGQQPAGRSWDDHARSLAAVFRSVASRQPIGPTGDSP